MHMVPRRQWRLDAALRFAYEPPIISYYCHDRYTLSHARAHATALRLRSLHVHAHTSSLTTIPWPHLQRLSALWLEPRHNAPPAPLSTAVLLHPSQQHDHHDQLQPPRAASRPLPLAAMTTIALTSTRFHPRPSSTCLKRNWPCKSPYKSSPTT